MNKKDYIVHAIKHEDYTARGWLLSALGILPDNTGDVPEEVKISVVNKELYVSLNNNDKPELIDDYIPGKPLYGVNEKVELKAGDLKCLKEDITSTYGILIINLLLIEYPYSGLCQYRNGEITPKIINEIAYNMLMMDEVTVAMHQKFENSISMTTALAQIAVPSATRRSITPNPALAIEKPKLLAEYKDRMEDPAAVAELQNKIMALDKEWLKGDESENFLLGEKNAMSRLRVMGMYGAEADFHDESKIQVMINSLSEGWEIEDIPLLANNIRGGSYNRGANTALGGQAVKECARIFQNYKVADVDCTTKLGVLIRIDNNNFSNLEGRYLVGSDKPLSKDNLRDKLGQNINLRSPAYCISPGTAICPKCFGDNVANSPIGINGLMITITSSFLNLFMQLVHSSSLTTTKYNYLDRIT